ncbi:hypothetical protein [Peribacillus kribbensis]|uniref:hypothetical protein n=1 Tax=Peribacillus kribbensis TaxID=356658 RepID=UPI0012DC99A0|nr:hypothetical protein [Peribacillus kribbensis]
MKETNLVLNHFVKENQFQLNSYLTYLFKQRKTACVEKKIVHIKREYNGRN